jgi:hypothetical protein
MIEETRGRPQKDPEETLSEQIAIAVSPSQEEIARLESDRCEVSVSELVRGVFFNGSLIYATRFGHSDISETLVNRSDWLEIRRHYSEPFPRDFQKLRDITTEITDIIVKDLRDGQTLEEVEHFLEDLEERLFEIYGEYYFRRGDRKELREEKENKRKTSKIQIRVRKKDWEWIDQVNRSCEVMEGNSSFVRRVLFLWIRMNEMFTRRRSLLNDIITEVIRLKQTIIIKKSDEFIFTKDGKEQIKEKSEIIEEIAEEGEKIAGSIEEVQRQKGFRSLRR